MSEMRRRPIGQSSRKDTHCYLANLSERWVGRLALCLLSFVTLSACSAAEDAEPAPLTCSAKSGRSCTGGNDCPASSACYYDTTPDQARCVKTCKTTADCGPAQQCDATLNVCLDCSAPPASSSAPRTTLSTFCGLYSRELGRCREGANAESACGVSDGAPTYCQAYLTAARDSGGLEAPLAACSVALDTACSANEVALVGTCVDCLSDVVTCKALPTLRTFELVDGSLTLELAKLAAQPNCQEACAPLEDMAPACISGVQSSLADWEASVVTSACASVNGTHAGLACELSLTCTDRCKCGCGTATLSNVPAELSCAGGACERAKAAECSLACLVGCGEIGTPPGYSSTCE